MVKWISQVVALTSFNLRTIPQRKGSSFSFMVGIAGVVAVFVGVLSIGQGISRTMRQTGSPDIALVLRGGADSEMTSLLLREETKLIGEAPGVARADGVALVSPELFVIINLPKRSTGTDANIPFRGVEKPVLGVRTGVKGVEGRMFGWGRNEVNVGRGALNGVEGRRGGGTTAGGLRGDPEPPRNVTARSGCSPQSRISSPPAKPEAPSTATRTCGTIPSIRITMQSYA